MRSRKIALAALSQANLALQYVSQDLRIDSEIVQRPFRQFKLTKLLPFV